jgi:putative salt-induced outer membrane protein YdiY
MQKGEIMRILYFMMAAVLLAVVPKAYGDELVLNNGEHVKGKISKMLDGKMTVGSETMGDVTVDLANILTFSTVDPIAVHFVDGSIFNQKVDASRDGWITIPVGPDQEPKDFRVEDIKKINPPKTQWKGSISGGATITRGNTYTQGANVSIDAERRSESDRISFRAGYTSTRTKDPDTGVLKTTQRRSLAALQYDYFLSEKWFTYVNAGLERDAIAQIDVRLSAGAGAGYQFCETEDFSASAEAGLSWVSENYLSPDPGDPPTDDEAYLAARINYKLDGKFNEAVSFFHGTTFFPAFEGAGGYYVISEGGLRSSLTDSMFAEAKALWNWDTKPANGKKRTDVIYAFAVGWSF